MGLRFLRELEPFAAGRAVIVPVKSRMSAQDLKAAANEKREEKKVEEVRRPQPQRIVKKQHGSHSQGAAYRREASIAIHATILADASFETARRSSLRPPANSCSP